MLPVAQLYVRRVPLLRPPDQADLLQVLWCLCERPPEYKPPAALDWRTAAGVTDIRAAPPEPSVLEYGDNYVPEPCLLTPEQITEYPNALALDQALTTLDDPGMANPPKVQVFFRRQIKYPNARICLSPFARTIFCGFLRA